MRKITSKAQLSLGDAPTVVLLVGLVFLVMATVAFIGQKYQATMTENSTAYNVTRDLQKEIGNNTSIAGIVLTIALVGIVLSILIGVFLSVRGGGRV
jgi:hypothetical protein